MKKIKSHFKFTKGERNGIFALLIIILGIQLSYYLYKQQPPDEPNEDILIQSFQNEIDSLKMVKMAASKPKIFPFNPNFITDYRGYALGMTNEEIDRLIAFRQQDRWINSVKQFQEVTQVSDSILNKISPYFKFPDWVTTPRPNRNYTNSYDTQPKGYDQKIDLNKASSVQLRKINGIGEVLSKRIVEYRSMQDGGFNSDIQLNEVYGLSEEVISRLTDQFTVKTPAPIHKINLNEASRDELVMIKYIDYDVAHNIIEYRVLHEGFKTLSELEKVKDFPLHKIEIIKLYLQI